MDDATGWCEGCMRTLDEIAAWAQLDDATRRAVRSQLRERRVEFARQRAQRLVPGDGA